MAATTASVSARSTASLPAREARGGRDFGSGPLSLNHRWTAAAQQEGSEAAAGAAENRTLAHLTRRRCPPGGPHLPAPTTARRRRLRTRGSDFTAWLPPHSRVRARGEGSDTGVLAPLLLLPGGAAACEILCLLLAAMPCPAASSSSLAAEPSRHGWLHTLDSAASVGVQAAAHLTRGRASRAERRRHGRPRTGDGGERVVCGRLTRPGQRALEHVLVQLHLQVGGLAEDDVGGERRQVLGQDGLSAAQQHRLGLARQLGGPRRRQRARLGRGVALLAARDGLGVHAPEGGRRAQQLGRAEGHERVELLRPRAARACGGPRGCANGRAAGHALLSTHLEVVLDGRARQQHAHGAAQLQQRVNRLVAAHRLEPAPVATKAGPRSFTSRRASGPQDSGPAGRARYAAPCSPRLGRRRTCGPRRRPAAGRRPPAPPRACAASRSW